MRNLKMTIEYDGTRYQGWQKLGDTDKTIQGNIDNIIKVMTEETTEIVGAGRTDGGTHAHGQVANFKTNSTLPLPEMLAFFHKYLPRDIEVKNIIEVPERFHARYNAKAKQYSYDLWTNPVPSAFEHQSVYQYTEPLDFALMAQACEKFVGKHDFIGFSNLKKKKKSTVRVIDACTMTREGNKLHFTFVGNGFLYKMVRIMMGTILEIGAGTMKLSDIDDVFASKVRAEAGITVPAQGLFLDEVFY